MSNPLACVVCDAVTPVQIYTDKYYCVDHYPSPEESTLREAEKLAKFFHDTYERLAPEYNYTTKKETRVFDPKSNNGQLMVAVASEVVKLIQEKERLARISELKQIEPPEEYEDYAKLSGRESCIICGFNAVNFRRYIEDRIKELKDEQAVKVKAVTK